MSQATGSPDAAALAGSPQAGWVRPLAVAAAILFAVSLVFPVGAGLAKDTASFPKWWGMLDVGTAFTLAFSVLAIQAAVRGEVDQQAESATYRTYRILIHGLLAVAVAVMVGSGWITWANCATGFLWRAWLLLYSLPSWYTALRSR
jgi:hypothetical protein